MVKVTVKKMYPLVCANCGEETQASDPRTKTCSLQCGGMLPAKLRDEALSEDARSTLKKCCSLNCNELRTNSNNTYCREHLRAYHRNWKNNKPKGILKNRRDAVRHLYKLDYDQYKSLILKPCEICGKYKPPIKVGKALRSQMHIDHDHQSNSLRGVLCITCNIALGGFKENVEYLENATKYLIKHGAEAKKK